MIKKYLIKIFEFLIDSLRPFFGSRSCCIYRITCGSFAKATLQKRPLYIAIPMIILRVLSCNPIMAILLKFKN